MQKNLKSHSESPSFSLCKPDETVKWATFYHWAEVIPAEPGTKTLPQRQLISKTEKNTWQLASVLIKFAFGLSVFSSCRFSVIPVRLLFFHSFRFSIQAFFILFSSSSIFDCPTRLLYQKGFFSSDLPIYQCFAPRVSFLPPPMPHTTVCTLFWFEKPSYSFIRVYMYLYICKRK